MPKIDASSKMNFNSSLSESKNKVFNWVNDFVGADQTRTFDFSSATQTMSIKKNLGERFAVTPQVYD